MSYRFLLIPLALVGGIISIAVMNPAHAQLFGSRPAHRAPAATVSAVVSPSSMPANGKAMLIVSVRLAAGYHVNAANTGSSELIPTVLSLKPAKGIVFGKVGYPQAQSVKEAYYDKPLQVYTGSPVIRVPISALHGARTGAHVISGTLSYQACNDKACLPPAAATFSANVTVK